VKLIITITAALALTFAAAAADTDKAKGKGKGNSDVKVQLKDAKGKNVGTATLMAHGDGVHINGQLRNLPPGVHAMHIHDTGSCEAPDFKSAGAHFNPSAKKHGDMNPEGHHAGDLPNITVAENGRVKLDQMVNGVTLGEGPNSLLKAGGTALVVHAKEDDRKTDPAGNAGDRIACGVITR
jgi:superoxide dismutase, Cu-Zn family